MTSTSNSIETVNSLLRGELAATETYQMAMDQVGLEPGSSRLREIHRDHREAANDLRICVRTHGATPDHSSGAWGAFARAVEGTAKLLGNAAALKALLEGEEHGKATYTEALSDNELPSDCRDLVSNRLLPQTERHIATLNGLMNAV